MVFSLRMLRRRGVGLVCKAGLLSIVIVTIIQCTTSAPSKHEVTHRVDSNFPGSVDLPNGDNAHQQDRQRGQLPPVQENIFHESGVKIEEFGRKHLETRRSVDGILHRKNDNLQVGRKLPQPVTEQQIQKADRKGQFYENIIIHFDLKGAPPKVSYLVEVLKLVAKSGATGILLEWEDMFPYTGILEQARNTDAYSMDDVHTILKTAKSLQLDIIPLVQTFAHLEWLLKLEPFRKYRTNDLYPQVVCMSNKEGVALIEEVINQVVEAHKGYGIPYFHIGCDEAFMYAECAEDLAWMRAKPDRNRETLALTHMKYIAEYVKNKVGDTTVLAWHDMLKNFSPQIIKSLQLGDVLEPVVWDYSEGIVTMNDWSFQTLADSFPNFWASSAYKGANYPSAKYIDVRHYEKNNRDWIDVATANKGKFKSLRGIIITGWQRYDHMACLCEFLPVGIPSMVLGIETALAAPNKEDQRGIRQRAAQKLNCSQGTFSVSDLELVNNNCNFPGFNIYAVFQRDVRRTVAFVESEMAKHHPSMGWLNPYNVKHNISQNWYLREIVQFLGNQHQQLKSVEKQLRTQLKDVFFDNTVEEIVFETIGEVTRKVEQMIKDADRLGELRAYPKRHFPIHNEL